MDKFNRKKTRKLLFQILFSETFNNFIAEDFYESFFNNTHNFIIDEVYMEKMVKIIKNYEYFFIHVIKKYSPKFDISKMSKVNIIPLYIAISEMFIIEEEIPVKVSINEAVELAKTYWDDSNKKIVNGILNKVFENSEELANDFKTIEKIDTYSIF